MRFMTVTKIAFLAGLLLIFVLPLAADFVGPELAIQAAQNWLVARYGIDGTALPTVQTFAEGSFSPCDLNSPKNWSDQALIYLVGFDDQGFALVSAQDNSIPILAYGSNPIGDSKPFPPAFLEWVGAYAAQIEEINSQKIELPEHKAQWSLLLSDNYVSPVRSDRSIVPLLATTWDQGWPYNELCPGDDAGPGGRVYAGCVATAMAMIMKYWSHPTTGVGSHSYYAHGYGYQSANFGNTTYLWDEMPNSVGTSNIPVATLLYHCGVAVEMGYSPDGSGANSDDAAWAMAQYFRYPNAQIKWRMQYTNSQWHTMMQDQLNNGSPMYYSGSGSSGGHAFCLDGYDDPNYYHFNFGWSGHYNGYYYMDAITAGGSSFNGWNSAIINTIPENYSIANTQVKLSSSGGATVGYPFKVSVSTNPLLASWGVDNYQLVLLYDSENLVFNGASIENTISASGYMSAVETQPGTILFTWNGSSSLAGGGTLVDFNFTPSDTGSYLFDIQNMLFDNSPVNNTDYLIVTAGAPVASLVESSISMPNVMHLGYGQIGTTQLQTTYLLPSWNVSHYESKLSFDPSKLEYVEYNLEGTLSENLEPEVVLESPGLLSINCDLDQPLTGEGSLMQLKFRAIGNANAISLTQVTPSDFFYNSTQITSLRPSNFILSPITAVQDETAPPPPELNVFPNPVFDEARLCFSGRKELDARIDVFNLKGQKLDTIIVPGKEREILWQASDRFGNRLGSGIYLLRWHVGAEQGSTRVLLIK
ncbi:MAG: streptopain [Candidatus Cloacimonetes bacterium]|nr:streptopain [Candidatus Cloacimonadota bacterium]